MSVTPFWGESPSPNVISTIRRFPLAILLQAAATLLLVAQANNWILSGPDSTWSRGFAGLMTGAVFALGGALFARSRPDRPGAAALLGFALPLVVIAAFQLRETAYFVPSLLLPVGLFWVSLSSFTDLATDQSTQQDRFWWFNHRVVIGAMLAVAGVLLVGFGLIAIDRALETLLGVKAGDIFLKIVLPIGAGFVAPFYWLTTIPELADYDAGALTEPDFVGRAVGLLTQFVLAPLLLAYAAILLVYTGQIMLAQRLPDGVVGRMVLGFTVAGGLTWLLLYPAFVRERAVARLFRRSWFWLTIIPLALLAFAIWTRISAYGLTPDRMIVLGGGLWAAAVTLIFLLRRLDIRLIPAVAAMVLLALSIGPWNFANAPRLDQARRLDQLLRSTGIAGPGSAAKWSDTTLEQARAGIAFLVNAPAGRHDLQLLLARHGVEYDGFDENVDNVLAALGTPGKGDERDERPLLVGRSVVTPPINLSATPFYIGPVQTWVGSTAEAGGRQVGLLGESRIRVSDDAGNSQDIDVDQWANDQGGSFETPWIDYDLGGIHYRIAMEHMTMLGPDGGGHRQMTMLEGTLYASAAERPVKPKAVKSTP